jgi:sugar (pentulose or hexulose) kinase
MEDTLLAVDCGTQSLRAMLFTRAGRLVAKEKVDYEPYFSLHPGWAEQDPRVYWGALCAAALALKARSGPAFARIQGVGVAALRNTPVLVDEAGEPVRPAILYLDRRKADRVYRPGWAMGPVYAAVGILPTILKAQEDCKTNWIRQHQPHLWERTHKALQVSGYLNHQLTGQFRDSVASQIGYLPFNYRSLRWCRPGELNGRVFPVEAHRLPELVAPGSPLGRITRAAGAATGIPEGVPVIACASDKGAESVGTGCIGAATACLSLGTAASVQTTTPRYFEPLAFFPAYPAAVAGSYSPEIQVFRGYWMISWFMREFAPAEREAAAKLGVPPEALLDRFLQEVPAGSLGLMTLPHWGPGLKSPGAKGSMIGLGEVHTRGYFYRSLIEGLGFALRDGLEQIERAGRARMERIAVAGGASQSVEICQITADIFGRELWAGETFEAAGLGVAALTAAGVGLHGGLAEAVRRMVRPGRSFAPRPANAELYRKLFLKVHRRIQGRLEPLHRQIRSILNYPEGASGDCGSAAGKECRP